MADDVLNYSQPGPFTSLNVTQLKLIEGLPDNPIGICAAAQSLVIQPADATASGIAEDRLAEKNIRPVSELIAVLTALDPSPLHQARTTDARVIGTCRHFATLACAFLRARGIPSRARCGFGTYFLEGRGVDHWIIEFWDADERRWVRVDVEHLGKHYVECTEDLAPGEFLTGGEAWLQYRQGLVDGQMFGVAGVDYAWGPAEISGNTIRDLAALGKREMLPWDEWGRMTDAYEGKTGPDYDQLIDEVADACSKGEPLALTRLFASEELAVPRHLDG
ncbi:transglutaminase-like domain-containing protein [Phytoactinopolyspora endophytica]|uniref:transglutaminase-like domain-containing protein n=1 Tax=Phytoactinopolyspora endophytica TaxID=1642495 RepID=UPI00101DF57D|nr:transglutaminase-like domain-containing protein [Phytoactinopolyspora endophytica]